MGDRVLVLGKWGQHEAHLATVDLGDKYEIRGWKDHVVELRGGISLKCPPGSPPGARLRVIMFAIECRVSTEEDVRPLGGQELMRWQVSESYNLRNGWHHIAPLHPVRRRFAIEEGTAMRRLKSGLSVIASWREAASTVVDDRTPYLDLRYALQKKDPNGHVWEHYRALGIPREEYLQDMA